MQNLPFEGRNRVTSIFGERNGVKHKGIDIVGDDNREILAVSNGIVGASTIVTNKNDKTWEWGNYVRIDCQDGTKHYYCHLESRKVIVGQKVNTGDVLGIMGNTGYSFGSHLHFEVRNVSGVSINPCTVLGITNQTGVYVRSIKVEKGDVNVKMGVYRAIEKTVSSQLLKEGAFAVLESDGLKLYERRMAREVGDENLSEQFDRMKAEMELGEILAITEQ